MFPAIKPWPMTVQDLKWQKDVDSNAQKIKQFQDVVGGLQDF